MWRNIAKEVSTRASCSNSLLLSRARSFIGLADDSALPNKFKLRPINSRAIVCFPAVGFEQVAELTNRVEFSLLSARNQMNVNGLCFRSYTGAAEAVEVAHTDVERDSKSNDSVCDDEVQELLKEVRKEERRLYRLQWRHSDLKGIGSGKYRALKRRQVKIETEAWTQAAKEYRELLNDMCEKKLAPNLPYMKTLFLGWFEPLRNKIAEEQELTRSGKTRVPYAEYFHQLPADMMAVITMYKLVSMLMTGGEHGSAGVVRAACIIGDAIEQEVRIHHVLEETNKKKAKKDSEMEVDESNGNIKEQEKLRERVTTLMRKQQLKALRHIVNRKFELHQWGHEARVKVGSRLLELILQTAYIQPPASQPADEPPDIRPAFIHTIRTVSKEMKTSGKRIGVIQCDPVVRKGLERTALDTLGSTRWRVNKNVLGVIDQLWARGGCIADLVDRNDIPLPEKPDTEDEDLIKKWKWKIKSIKKENSKRHSLRCDTELKLAVARKLKEEDGFFYPHNLDFRGRAYPMHPHLNHLGSDICRGILEFAEGRPLGKSGLHWLKIHLANLFANGVDKLSYEGRIAFTENHLDDIFDSADIPLEGNRWWLNAEDPFQCLAACINLAQALRSPCPETTISHIPVHQDGSCNGLQHYAALGRDKEQLLLIWLLVKSLLMSTPGWLPGGCSSVSC